MSSLVGGFEDICVRHALFLTGRAEGSHMDRRVPDTGHVPRAAGGHRRGVSQGGRLGACVEFGFPAWPHLWDRVSTPLTLAGVSSP